MFFMAKATLLAKNLSASSHKGAIGLFGKHFIKAGIFDKSWVKILGDAHDKRMVEDYGVGFAATK